MATEQFFLVVLVVLVGCFSLCFLRGKYVNKPYNGPVIYPIVGCAYDFFKNRHRFLQWFTEIMEKMPTNTFKLERPGGVRDIMIANPANVEHMLKTNFENYPKGERYTTLLHDFLGRGIFNVDGELWKMQRKTASYEFNTISLRSFVVETVQWEIQNRLLPVLTSASKTGKSLDLQDILQRFAFDNICSVAFGMDPACLLPSMPISPFAKAFDDATEISAGRFYSAVPFWWRVKRMLNIGSEKRLREAIKLVDKFAMDVVSSRRKETSVSAGGPEREDLLSRLMAALSSKTDEFEIDNESESEKQSCGTMDVFLKEMVVSFLLAGRDTTSATLTWFFWVLSSHLRVEEAIHTEVLQILAKRSQTPPADEEGISFSFEELKDMQYLHAALCESMRLYPPVPVDPKLASKDDVLPDGTSVAKGTHLNYCNYSMGRMENIWGSDCLQFKPERWLKEGEFVGDNPYKFPVFHAGPRVCLGKAMAFIQMKSIVASVIHGFSFKVEDGIKCPDYVVSLTMRMKGGLPVTVRCR
ncbi:cytochrome P450 94A2 [Cryptomeria japonica]|uniref:cytochrome P450 94A2 n=1 Tax=Cryptomeria japonica TaxID=3369 RepID=UPI0025AD0FD0|nr:cytochrome P450 94A2 [Cryptomeria japonica]